MSIVYLKKKCINIEGTNTSILNTIITTDGVVIADYNPISWANYIDVNFNNIIDPRIIPVNWFVTDTLDVIWAWRNYLLAKLSNDISWSVINNTDPNNNIAIL